nr:ABC transporter permease [Clostridia bacterium]
KKTYKAFEQIPNAVATKNRYDYDSADIKTSFEFAYKSETTMLAMMEQGLTESSFTADGKDYTVSYDGEKAEIYTIENGESVLYSNVSRYIVDSIYEDIFLDIGFKNYVKDLIAQGVAGIQEFTYPDEDGEERLYTIEVGTNDWIIRWIEDTFVILDYDAPSKAHPVGTDGNGMDLLTRLMYGGRVSLIIGFIVVIIETAIGVVLGGIAGYFGKWVDNLIMRIVDTFNSIPSLPIIIILGFMMDQQRVDPLVRMMYLMVILAVLGWPGIARMVRGQILSLREQEFMIAAEATGISVSKRIFKHLIPNVMPQLIVISTLSLGGVILMESTLSFLGLGVKFPFASWGNIINAVSNAHVMTNYLFVWIPAGFCILITVLGFNFIGDGLRDAFDPRMKR